MEIKGGGVEEGRGVGTVMVWKKKKITLPPNKNDGGGKENIL